MSIRTNFIRALTLLAFSLPCIAAAETLTDYRDHAEFPAFAERMQREYGFTSEQLNRLFEGVHRQQAILDAIAKPAEGKDWHEYRPIFLTNERISAGVKFWNEHAATLARAEKEFGVDAEAIVALIGIETFYGRITGNWRVIEALATLGFDYPPRSQFFRSQLEHFLLLVREEDIDVKTVTGSYAGAMGGGQFMPSSYRDYAVDFDKDGKRDLWHSWPDVIGSVANYLSRHGWRHGDVIAVPAAVHENRKAPLSEQGMKEATAASLRHAGMVFSEGVANDTEVRLVALKRQNGFDYWIGLKNFGVINRYNRSPLYAMAALELGHAISRQRNGG